VRRRHFSTAVATALELKLPFGSWLENRTCTFGLEKRGNASRVDTSMQKLRGKVEEDAGSEGSTQRKIPLTSFKDETNGSRRFAASGCT
jgi:hypothetical protein